jgi:hypothetical protein
MTQQSRWSNFALTLDDDERLIWPHMYLPNRHLYDDIRGVAYIVQNQNFPDSQWEWVYAHKLDQLLCEEDACAIEVIAKMLVVRLRLPWNKMIFERFMSEAELNKWREHVDVIDIQLRVWDKEQLQERYLFDMSDFHQNRDRYIVRERKYLTIWKPTPELFEEATLLEIDPVQIEETIRSLTREI